jgi:hypothetical protein
VFGVKVKLRNYFFILFVLITLTQITDECTNFTNLRVYNLFFEFLFGLCFAYILFNLKIENLKTLQLSLEKKGGCIVLYTLFIILFH